MFLHGPSPKIICISFFLRMFLHLKFGVQTCWIDIFAGWRQPDSCFGPGGSGGTRGYQWILGNSLLQAYRCWDEIPILSRMFGLEAEETNLWHRASGFFFSKPFLACHSMHSMIPAPDKISVQFCGGRNGRFWLIERVLNGQPSPASW